MCTLLCPAPTTQQCATGPWLWCSFTTPTHSCCAEAIWHPTLCSLQQQAASIACTGSYGLNLSLTIFCRCNLHGRGQPASKKEAIAIHSTPPRLATTTGSCRNFSLKAAQTCIALTGQRFCNCQAGLMLTPQSSQAHCPQSMHTALPQCPAHQQMMTNIHTCCSASLGDTSAALSSGNASSACSKSSLPSINTAQVACLGSCVLAALKAAGVDLTVCFEAVARPPGAAVWREVFLWLSSGNDCIQKSQ